MAKLFKAREAREIDLDGCSIIAQRYYCSTMVWVDGLK